MIDFDLTFDPSDPGKAHDEPVVFTRWAKMCFIPGLPVKKVFEAGTALELPGITRTTYEKGQQPVSSGEPFTVPLLTVSPGSKDKLFYIILREANRDGQEFDTVLRFKNWNETVQMREVDEYGLPVKNEAGKNVYKKVKGEDGKYLLERNSFYEFQVPELDALKKSNPTGYDKLQQTGKALFAGSNGAWVYVKCFMDDTGYDLGGEVRQYVKDITIFDTKEAWEAAKAQAGQSPNGVVNYDHFPIAWKNAPEQLIEFVKGANQEGKSHKDIATEGMMSGEAIGGGQVDTKALLAELLDLPVPMVKL